MLPLFTDEWQAIKAMGDFYTAILRDPQLDFLWEI
jgi:hypothetical protein